MTASHASTTPTDDRLALIAQAIGEPSRARMLCCLLDGHARTATELATVGGVGAPTASGHLARLREQGLVALQAQGKHRYFTLANSDVSAALEALLVVAGVQRTPFKASTPDRLRTARSCYDHMAGEVAVALHDNFVQRGWLIAAGTAYDMSAEGEAGFAALGIDVPAVRASRRRMACPCMDWSERRPHLAGALGAALLERALANRWVRRDLDSRALALTAQGQKALASFGLNPT